MIVYLNIIFKCKQSRTNQYLETHNSRPESDNFKSILAIIFFAAVFWNFFVFAPPCAWAGPPFVTDDPEPVEFQHWEVYLAAQYKHDRDQDSSTLPHLEINYGAIPNLQIHLIAPLVYVKPEGSGSEYGYGDTELGVKFRFIQETDYIPQVGIFPMIEFPTGDSDKGLGNGRTQYSFPYGYRKTGGHGQPMGERDTGLIPATGIRTGGSSGGKFSGKLLKC